MNSRIGIFATAIFCFSLFSPAAPVGAQEEEAAEQKTRRVMAMSERVHRRLFEASEAMEVDDYVTAETRLAEILELRNITPYERAQAERLVGFLHVRRDDYPAAIESFLGVTRIGGPDEIAGLYNEAVGYLSQLYIQVENYREAIRYGEISLALKEDPTPMDYIRIATAHLQLEEWQEAVDYIATAIERAQATGVEVEEDWWRRMAYAYYGLEQFADALEVTKILVAEWPSKAYWLQMSGLYYSLEDEDRQVAATWSAFEQGMLTSSSELVQMAQFFLMKDVPYKAAVILHEGLENGSIEPTARNFRLEAQAWQLAQEDRMALEPLRKSAEGEDDLEDQADLYMRLAESHYALNDYEQCASVARQTLGLGDLENEGRLNMLLGQCLFEQEEYDAAEDAFARAIRDSDTRRAATRWRDYLRSEVARLRDLDARLARFGG
ncbi:tetratricopeptide repeat protein [Candidatus Foliamicus sp.]